MTARKDIKAALMSAPFTEAILSDLKRVRLNKAKRVIRAPAEATNHIRPLPFNSRKTRETPKYIREAPANSRSA